MSSISTRSKENQRFVHIFPGSVRNWPEMFRAGLLGLAISVSACALSAAHLTFNPQPAFFALLTIVAAAAYTVYAIPLHRPQYATVRVRR